VHRVLGLDEDVTTLPVLLARLRGLGVTGLRLVLPVPGDAVGLPGPAAFNLEALEAGEAVVAAGTPLGLVPRTVGGAVEWRLLPVDNDGARLPLPSLGEADRALREELLRVTTLLADMDLARWSPAAARALAQLRAPADSPLAPGYPARAVEVVNRAQRLSRVVRLATSDDGAAVSRTELDRRAAALHDLDRVCRAAVVAAYNAAPASR
jgi:hypothetical protein